MERERDAREKKQVRLSRNRNCFDKRSETLISHADIVHLFNNEAMKVQQLELTRNSTELPVGTGWDVEEFDNMGKDIKVIALVKGEEQYVFLYSDSNRAETLRLLGRYASNPELSFTWYDAAVLSQKIRQESLQQAREKQRAESSRVPLSLDELF